MPIPANCENITDILIREQGRVSGDLYTRVFARSPWIRLVRRGVFPDGMGHTISVVTYERSAPTDANPTWSAMSGSETGTGLTAYYDAAEGGACLPSYDTVDVGSTIRTYALCRRVLHGPDFCVEQIRYSFQLRDQLAAVMDALTEHVMIEWEVRDRHEYLRLCRYKVVCHQADTSNGETYSAVTSSNCTLDGSDYTAFFGATQPTSVLQQGHLNRWRMRLIRDGAALSALGQQGGSPILTLICSAETSDDILRKNQDIVQDLRWGKPSELLAPLGVERSYRGYYHLIDTYPIRGNWEGGVFTEAAAFVTAAKSKGNGVDINSTWENAYMEISYIFDPTVFEQLIPRPITTPESRFKFDPVNYTGDWKVMNIIDRYCNPDGTILFHRGIMAAGSKPVHPERGAAFVHIRCEPAVETGAAYACS